MTLESTESSNPAGPRVISGVPPIDPGAAARATLKLDPDTFQRATDCVHCGLCLPACPTYTQNGLESDSPRGRIHLMKGLAEGRIGPSEAVLGHLDLCLDCRACETACPSGVVYHELIEATREHFIAMRPTTLTDKLLRWVFFHLFPHPTRLKVALLPARVLQKLGLWGLATHRRVLGVLPAQFQKMAQMLPPDGPLWERRLASPVKPTTATRRVGLFTGCIGSVLYQEINRQTVAILERLGCEVVIPTGQACCGAIHHHGGDSHEAKALARKNLEAFLDLGGEKPLDWIVTNIAGCGAMLREYDDLLRDDPALTAKAKALSEKMRDISEVLVELGKPTDLKPVPMTVTYHDACHLRHAQQVADPPRQILSWIPGMRVVPLAESEICCGAAGTYNLSQPAMARDLAERKLRNIAATGARVCVMGNVGCAMQIDSEARRMGMPLRVVHPVTLLHAAMFGGED
ncbi:MAG: 4Fe-4S dicluster domain-containing protein [Phycisphaeraceae bacterium]|nr:4Fe-4S dicluster domain-containing protein [Phycisphaeraceae bacterium]